MTPTSSRSSRFTSLAALGRIFVPAGLSPVVLYLALATVALHLLGANGYGYFRDELYYIACTKRLAWGYVDHPPFSVALLALSRTIFGDSRLAIRLLPALCGGVVVWLTGWLAREMGGRTVSQTLAALCALVAPYYLAIDHFYSMNAFEILFWTVAVCILAHIFGVAAAESKGEVSAEEGKKTLFSWWIALGVVLGLGLLNKLSMLWLMSGIGAGIVVSPHRRLLASKGPFVAVAIAAVIFAPHVVWQIVHGFPTREFVRHATEDKMVAIAPLSFVAAQILELNPLTALLWVPGLFALLFGKRLVPYRPFAIAYLAILALLLFNQKSRTGYLGPAYPMLFAAGGALVEPICARVRGAAVALISLLAIGGTATAPLAVPLLPIEGYISYARALGQVPKAEEKNELGVLPQFYADMFGWPEMARAMEDAVRTLTPDEKGDAVILGNNYGEAAAFEFFGHDLPPVASGHNSYWLWGPGNPDSRTVLLLGHEPMVRERFRRLCASFEPRGRIAHPLAMPYENDLTIYLCRAHEPLGPNWATFAHYN